LITKQIIDEYIRQIPPVPKILKQTILFVDQGELTKASKIASQDLALKHYLIDIVNKPYYGFSSKVTDLSQIFGILGQIKAKQILHTYLMNIMNPKEWKFFKLNHNDFIYFQVTLTNNWNKILAYKNINEDNISISITILPLAVLIIEHLFKKEQKEIELIRSYSDIDLNTILKRLSGYTLFDIATQIAKKWELPSKIYNIIESSSGLNRSNDNQIDMLGKWMHLLLFHTISQEQLIGSGLNDFIEFKIDYVSNIYEEFLKIMDIDK